MAGPTINHYKQAIRLLSQGNLPAADIVTKLAEERPDVFVEVCNSLDISAYEQWVKDAKAQLDGGHKLKAIKTVREATKMGLKEAKDYVEQELVKIVLPTE